MAAATTHNETDIERIVAMVVERLRGAAVDQPASQEARSRSQPGQLFVSERVVGMDAVDGRLAGVRRVVVAHGAVVTPALKDHLREKQISLEHGAATEAPERGTSTERIVVGVAGDACRAEIQSRLADVCAAAVDPLPAGELPQVTGQVAEEVRRGNVKAILFAAPMAAAMCLANRHSGVRAIACRTAAETRSAAVSVGANVLVLGEPGLSTWQQLEMIRVFANETDACCPPGLSSALDRVGNKRT